jgi:hypothetical protein
VFKDVVILGVEGVKSYVRETKTNAEGAPGGIAYYIW